MRSQASYTRAVEPLAAGWRRFAWNGGVFDTGHRLYTEAVEGTIHTPDHLVLVTLRGGAKHLEVWTDCGHHYTGPDRPGAVSFVPADCERRLKLKGVSSEWASISLSPGLFNQRDDEIAPSPDLRPFSNVEDPFVAGLVGELARLHAADGALDPAYCETMSHALACYLSRRYGPQAAPAPTRPWKLAPWRIRRITDYIEAHIGEEILIGDLATLVGLSVGHLHRAFRATTGATPLDYINEKRIKRAVAILAVEPVSVAELALRVGFVSPSHFTRTFRRVTGVNPSRFRSEHGGPLFRMG